MRIAIIGRSELLFKAALLLKENGHDIPLIITAKEAPEYKVTATDFENLAEKWGSVFIKTARINEPGCVEQIKKIREIDIAVSINYSGIIAQSIIDLFRLGVLNAHGGDLPKYRGNACQAWAIINKEKRIALCIHKMVGGELDSGNIITRSYYELDVNTRIGEVYQWMEDQVPLLVSEAATKLGEDPLFCLEEQSKDPADALRCYPRIPADGRLNWREDNESVIRLINASSEPFSGAFSYLNNQCIRIWRATIFEDDEIYLAVPGQVAKILDDNSVIVITGNGKIRITEISLGDAGDRILPGVIIKSIRQRFE